ncbi:hypothetical protein ACH6EH_04540 [Paenibacillus sp. JSM ZJ436]|uniref:hypothetical protein n=1 Tax=Paenibacillus sp. JSM ZJ436 TaxID=3376190 RepID=UPI00379DC661
MLDRKIGARTLGLLSVLGLLLFQGILWAAEAEPQLPRELTASSVTAVPVYITEVYPDDRSHHGVFEGAGGADLFEFVEIVNMSEEAVDFNERYALYYVFGAYSTELSVRSGEDIDAKVILPAQSTAVLWVKRSSSGITGAASRLTKSDFRAYHQLEAQVPVFQLEGQDGLHHADRGLVLTARGDSTVVSEVFYGAGDVQRGGSIHVKPPHKGNRMLLLEQRSAPSPGALLPEQQLFPGSAPE